MHDEESSIGIFFGSSTLLGFHNSVPRVRRVRPMSYNIRSGAETPLLKAVVEEPRKEELKGTRTGPLKRIIRKKRFTRVYEKRMGD